MCLPKKVVRLGRAGFSNSTVSRYTLTRAFLYSSGADSTTSRRPKSEVFVSASIFFSVFFFFYSSSSSSTVVGVVLFCFFNFPMCGLFFLGERGTFRRNFSFIYQIFFVFLHLGICTLDKLTREEKTTAALSSLPNLVFANLVRTPITLINVPGTTGGTLVIIIIIIKERERVTQVEFCI